MKVQDGYLDGSPLLDYTRCYTTSIRDMKGSFSSVSSRNALSIHFISSGGATIQGHGFKANFTMQPVQVGEWMNVMQ